MQFEKIKKAMRGLLWFTVMAVVLVALLAAANRMPSLMHKDLARQYTNVEEAKRALGLETVLAPAYFPEGISWPPSLIFAQKKPFQAVVMEFQAASKETVMIIIQSSLPENKARLQRINISELKEETQYVLKGRTALLQVGTCGNGAACSRMTWQDRGLYCTVVLMSSPFELIKIADSMIR